MPLRRSDFYRTYTMIYGIESYFVLRPEQEQSKNTVDSVSAGIRTFAWAALE